MYDVINRNTGEVRTYTSEATARFMLSRLGPDWDFYTILAEKV